MSFFLGSIGTIIEFFSAVRLSLEWLKKKFLRIRVRNRRHPYGITIYEKIRSGGAEVRIVSTNLVDCMHTNEDFIERREKKKKSATILEQNVSD